jgi:hypothetical protein
MLEEPTPFEHRDTPLPDPEPLLRTPAQINSSTKVKPDITPPLNTKRRSFVRTASFKFGEGLNSYSLARTSSLLYAELSDALKDLQRTIGSTAVEVH